MGRVWSNFLTPQRKQLVVHWGMELVVVVTGVLLALWATQWAGAREQRERDALSESSLREEVAGNVATLADWQALDQCYRDAIAQLRDMLVATDGNWPGFDQRAVFAEADSGRLIPGFLVMWAQVPDDDAWLAAIRNGAVDRMDPDKRSRYQRAYYFFHNYRAQMEQAREARSQLSALVFPGSLLDSDRLAALRSLSELDGAREYIIRKRDFLPLELTDDEIRQIKEANSTRVEALREAGARPCVKGPVWPLDNGEDE